ncbi:hypothetical protein [Halalkalicoccus salilacus]
MDDDDDAFEEPGGTEDLSTGPRTVFNAPEISVETFLRREASLG